MKRCEGKKKIQMRDLTIKQQGGGRLKAGTQGINTAYIAGENPLWGTY